MRLGSPWPDTATAEDGGLVLGGVPAAELAERFRTPLYVYDAETLRARARSYAAPVASHAGGGFVAFALKANPTVGLLRVLAAEGLGADVASPGELAAALRAGVPAERIVVHGNAKSDEDIEAAVAAGCRLLVVDGLDEPRRVAAAAERLGRRQGVAVRVTPGIRAGGHEHIETGGPASKFGLGPEAAADCVRRCQAEAALDFAGLHVHLGSQIEDAAPLEGMADWLAGFCADHGIAPGLLDLGGGLGIAYEDEPAPDAGRLAEALVRAVERRFPGAAIVLEPGRSVAGPAGVTLYRVIAVKTATDGTRFAAVDGGMSDNVRPALYGARYTVVDADRLGEPIAGAVDVVGKHCESGDVVARAARLPEPRAGDLLAVAATGAYGQSMASTYNGTPRPAAVLVDGGEARLVTRRETVEELLARDV